MNRETREERTQQNRDLSLYSYGIHRLPVYIQWELFDFDIFTSIFGKTRNNFEFKLVKYWKT